MNPVLKRTVTALATAAVVVCAIVYAPPAVISWVLIALIGLVHLEFSQMVSKKHEILVWPGVLTGVLWLAWWYAIVSGGGRGAAELALRYATVAGMAGVGLTVLFGRFASPITALATTVLGFAYVPAMLTPMLLMIVPDGTCHACVGELEGWQKLLYVLAIVKISDMGGFAFGLSSKRLFGDNHRMCPTISPNKSWEGMFGSVFGSCLVSALFMPMTHFGWGKALALGVAAAVVGTLGDLVESRFKRECGVKDSATFMPAGMGGFLDMFDSLVFASALLAAYL